MPRKPTVPLGEVRLPDAAAVAPGPTVLLVDDDAAVRASLKFSLELEGFDVEDFASAEAVAERPEGARNSCLIIDYHLPGMDGLALLALLRSRGSRAPAIVITSNPPRTLRAALAQADAILVEKPLLCDELSATIRAALA